MSQSARCAGSLGLAYATRANATGRDPRWTLGRLTIAAAPLSGLDWRRSVPAVQFDQ